MQVSVRVMKGSLLKVAEKTAVLSISEYCPSTMRDELISKANLVVAKLGKITELHQGVFLNTNSIVMENRSKTIRIRFSWKGDTLITQNLMIPKSEAPRRRREAFTPT